MGMYLMSPKVGDFRWNICGWGEILQTMRKMGWVPKGTLHFTYDSRKHPSLSGRVAGYDTNDGQMVTWEDAQGMLGAINKLIDFLEKVDTVDVGVNDTSIEVSSSDLSNVFMQLFQNLEDAVKQESGDLTPEEVSQWLQGLDYIEGWRDYLQESVDTKTYFEIW